MINVLLENENLQKALSEKSKSYEHDGHYAPSTKMIDGFVINSMPIDTRLRSPPEMPWSMLPPMCESEHFWRSSAYTETTRETKIRKRHERQR